MNLVRTACMAAFLVGCSGSVDYIDDPTGDPWGQDLERGRIEGEIGRFQARTESVYGWSDAWDNGLFVDIRGKSASGIVMAMIDVSNVDLRSLHAGQILRGGGALDSDGAWSPDEPWLMLTGCGGEIDDVWEEDLLADEVEIEIVEIDDESLTIEFAGVLEVTGQAIEGEVNVPLQ